METNGRHTDRITGFSRQQNAFEINVKTDGSNTFVTFLNAVLISLINSLLSSIVTVLNLSSLEKYAIAVERLSFWNPFQVSSYNWHYLESYLAFSGIDSSLVIGCSSWDCSLSDTEDPDACLFSARRFDFRGLMDTFRFILEGPCKPSHFWIQKISIFINNLIKKIIIHKILHIKT